MEFSAGLMPLETALTQMLSRITPLTAVETLPLVNCFGRILATDIVSPSMSPALIIQLWMVMRYAWRICPPISRCPSPQSICRSALPVESGLREPAFAL